MIEKIDITKDDVLKKEFEKMFGVEPKIKEGIASAVLKDDDCVLIEVSGFKAYTASPMKVDHYPNGITVDFVANGIYWIISVYATKNKEAQ